MLIQQMQNQRFILPQSKQLPSLLLVLGLLLQLLQHRLLKTTSWHAWEAAETLAAWRCRGHTREAAETSTRFAAATARSCRHCCCALFRAASCTIAGSCSSWSILTGHRLCACTQQRTAPVLGSRYCNTSQGCRRLHIAELLHVAQGKCWCESGAFAHHNQVRW